jgi:hypothetical protein
MTGHKTRQLVSKDDWKCPMHNTHVETKNRSKLDHDTGRKKYAGTFFSCPHYQECGYYVTFSGRVRVLEELDVQKVA